MPLDDGSQAIRQQIWHELARASRDRHHAWRTPVLATTGRDGMANARTVVLRDADASRQTLRIFTDRRSPKIGELVKTPRALLVFWSARLNWQLRVQVDVTILTEGDAVESVWQRVRQSAAAADYLGPSAPGSPRVEASGDGVPVAAGASHHLAVLNAHVCEMDWLELGRAGHRRARWLAGGWEWLTP